MFASVRSLRIRAVGSESSLGAFWMVKDAKFFSVDNKDSDHTDLSLRLAHMSEGTFSHVVVHIQYLSHPISVCLQPI